MKCAIYIAVLLAGHATAAWPADAPSWNGFRGPQHGISPWSNAPVAWDGASGKGVLWKTPLKIPGVSSPSVWGDRIFITEGDDHERALLAFDARTGRQLWRQVVADGAKDQALPTVSDTGLALPTPACDADGVYALFGTGDLAAFSHDGKPKWQLFLKRPVLGYGFASSPCVVNNLLFVQFDDYRDGRVLALDTTTGKVKWEHERSRGASWSSPIIIPDKDGQPLLVANANGSVTAFDLAGKIVWDVDGVTGQVTPTPAWSAGRLYPVNIGSPLLCYKVAATPVKEWEFTGHLSDTGSPIALNGLLFMATRSGQLTCVDGLSGKEIWCQKAPGSHASLTASDGRVYLLGRNGTMVIFAAERSYRAIATCSVPDGTDATPAFADGRIFIRGRGYLWCLGVDDLLKQEKTK